MWHNYMVEVPVLNVADVVEVPVLSVEDMLKYLCLMW